MNEPTNSSFDKTIFLSVGFLFIIGLMGVWTANLFDVESADLQGQTAADFSLTLFDQFDEDAIRLNDLQGQVVVINFWASWCVQCYEEAELLEQAWRDYQAKGVVFIGVDYLDTDKPALKYMEKYGITYPSGPDIGDKISRDYAITGVPETFFIDKDGKIAHVKIGPIERAELYGLIDRLLAQPRSEP